MTLFCNLLKIYPLHCLVYLLNIFLKFLVTLWALLSLLAGCDEGGGGGGGEAGGQEMMTMGDTETSAWAWHCDCLCVSLSPPRLSTVSRVSRVSSPLCQDTLRLEALEALLLLFMFLIPSLGRFSSKLWVLQLYGDVRGRCHDIEVRGQWWDEEGRREVRYEIFTLWPYFLLWEQSTRIYNLNCAAKYKTWLLLGWNFQLLLISFMNLKVVKIFEIIITISHDIFELSYETKINKLLKLNRIKGYINVVLVICQSLTCYPISISFTFLPLKHFTLPPFLFFTRVSGVVKVGQDRVSGF